MSIDNDLDPPRPPPHDTVGPLWFPVPLVNGVTVTN